MSFQFKSLQVLIATVLMAITGTVTTIAQNITLTAAQMSIYYGHPKRVTTTSNQGTFITEFDRQGRIQSITQGNMRIVYNWASDGTTVTCSVYNGQNFQGGGVIQIAEMTKTQYKYTLADMTDVIVTFKKNRAINKVIASNPQMLAIEITYLYHNADDIYPYATKYSMDNQLVQAKTNVNKTDSYGNAIEVTEEAMGQKAITTRDIIYY